MTEKVKVVIEMPKDRYEWIKEHRGSIDYTTTEMLYSRVRKGTLLNEMNNQKDIVKEGSEDNETETERL